jgi:hypothetical protein
MLIYLKYLLILSIIDNSGMTVKDDDLVISESNQPSLITTGIIKKLYPKWGLLEAKVCLNASSA